MRCNISRYCAAVAGRVADLLNTLPDAACATLSSAACGTPICDSFSGRPNVLFSAEHVKPSKVTQAEEILREAWQKLGSLISKSALR